MSGAKHTDRTEALRRFKPYPSYKDSGVEWLGEIPTTWQSKRLRFVAPIRVSKLNVKPDDALYVGLENVESWTGRLLLDTQPESVDSVVGTFKAGDVLFGKLRPYLAKAASPDFDGVSTSEILALRPTSGGFQRYVMYCLLNAPYIRWVDSLTFGTKMPRLSPEQVSSSFVAVPSEAEQRAIAAFLDRETAGIDALVAKKERLIELLQEQRTALITRAVTKGLDPKVPMKDSGVECLGEIPAHWDLSRLKEMMKGIEQGWSPLCENRQADEGEWAVLKAGCVNGEEFDEAEHKALPAELEPVADYEVRSGDILMSRANTRELLGSAVLVRAVRTRLLLCDKLYRIRVMQGRVLPEFVVRAVGSRVARFQLEREATGASGSMQNISQETISNLLVSVPSMIEQRSIADFLDCETARIDALVAKVRSAIDRLKELRTTLISAAVTGKIDVRGEVA
ncbi:MAG TPA: restriction endonuclease subunit S [Thermoanaerobaculia bacterium]|nr:restriction endonuclease subunit S [Thermoanaerobaculia bacterium]